MYKVPHVFSMNIFDPCAISWPDFVYGPPPPEKLAPGLHFFFDDRQIKKIRFVGSILSWLVGSTKKTYLCPLLPLAAIEKGQVRGRGGLVTFNSKILLAPPPFYILVSVFLSPFWAVSIFNSSLLCHQLDT